jgi:hypothetical protein
LRRADDAHIALIWGFCLGDMFCFGMLKVGGVEVLQEFHFYSFLFSLLCLAFCSTLVLTLCILLSCSLLSSVSASCPVLYSFILF